ncbi:hypothetical protein [Sphingomonas alba]|uniref:Ferritin-like domain-containing protein n=1 Tax=Sphingomonas alba TaxID=2908208 RepID=A0ABT0RP71_9SPHN|nr:hypothetical protein [Sphingomonas alba]MCL6684104.1 hypothetical protein [Sphingomonas alba]
MNDEFDDHYARNDPFSVAEFQRTKLGKAVLATIEEHADRIRSAADAGEPPISFFEGFVSIVDERLHWSLIEWMIRDWLGPEYKRAGRKPVPLRTYRQGQCYERTRKERSS